MKKGVKIALKLTVILLMTAFMCTTGYFCYQQQQQVTCQSLVVNIARGDTLGFVTNPQVEQWLENAHLLPLKKTLYTINTDTIKQLVEHQTYVKRAHVYTTGRGEVTIEIEQRQPILRLCLSDGTNAYLDREGTLLPLTENFVLDLPVVTSVYSAAQQDSTEMKKETKSEIFLLENSKLLDNLLNFVEFVSLHEMWNALFVQINITEKSEIELVPRIGSHIVLMGELVDYPQKLRRLEAFYKSEMKSGNFNSYRYINLKYTNQVVCTK